MPLSLTHTHTLEYDFEVVWSNGEDWGECIYGVSTQSVNHQYCCCICREL